MRRRSRVLWFGGAAALVAAGVACAVASDAVALQAVGVALVAGGLIVAVSLVFFEIGLSEDQERARETAPPEQPKTPAGRTPRPPPPRLRRRPRRRG